MPGSVGPVYNLFAFSAVDNLQVGGVQLCAVYMLYAVLLLW